MPVEQHKVPDKATEFFFFSQVPPTRLFSGLHNDMDIHYQTSLSHKQLLTLFLQLEILYLSIDNRLYFLVACALFLKDTSLSSSMGVFRDTLFMGRI